MTMNDSLAMALSNILNAERVGKAHCAVSPISNITKAVHTIMNEYHYIGAYKLINDGKG